MTKKIFKISLIIGATVLIFACGQKNENTELIKKFNSLYLLYAETDSGYLPLKMFSENDSLFVQYIKNGKSLEKIALLYSHLQKDEYNDTSFVFDEFINGGKKGAYIIPNEVFDTISHLGNYVDFFLKYKNKEKEIGYAIVWSLSKNRNIDIDTTEVEDEDGNFTIEYDNNSDLYYYATYEKPALDFIYSIFSNPLSIEKTEFDEIDKDNIWNAKDGNLRIYYQRFYQGGNGWGSDYPLEIVQFKDKNTVSAFGDIDRGDEQLHLENFIYTTNITINTVKLNNKTYYLIDRAMYDAMPVPYKDDEGYYSNGEVIQIYTIENGELLKKKLFNTTKNVIDLIAIEYDDSKFIINDNKLRENKWNLFKYDENEKTIYVPLVDELKLTDKYLLYQWDGKYFTYKGIGKYNQ